MSTADQEAQQTPWGPTPWMWALICKTQRLPCVILLAVPTVAALRPLQPAPLCNNSSNLHLCPSPLESCIPAPLLPQP